MAVIIYSSAYALGSLHDGTPLNIYNDVVNCILAHAKDTESSAKLPALLSRIYQRGVDAGLGEEDRAALVNVLK